MAFDIIPRSFWNVPNRVGSIFDDLEDFGAMLPSSGLSVSEDENHVYVEAHVPGLDPKNIEVTFDKGVLWIKGKQEDQEEDKKRKYYRKSAQAFSYHVSVPGNIDPNQEPDATVKNGIMKVTFAKMAEEQPKRINVKAE
ncbi:MAG TPA: Hsp20/alpha crystallin family protein [Patescibacteria group bacterium]|nr:Hsp20/alpha crystallin family protein [Patescibacteria group bacterium]